MPFWSQGSVRACVRNGTGNMKLLKLINRMSYLLFVTGLTFSVLSCVILFAASPLFHTDIWWMPIAALLLASLCVFIRGIFKLRSRGLNYSATVGDLTEAIDQDSS
jgi:hypothetical protein